MIGIAWKPYPESTLHDSNNRLATFDDLSLFLHKMWSSWLFALRRKKLNFFFKNRKLTFIWLGWMNCYYDLWIESTHLRNVSTFRLLPWYLIFKKFSFTFLSAKWKSCIIPYNNKNSIKIFFQVLDITYHDKLLEICFGAWFFISDDAGSIWAM